MNNKQFICLLNYAYNNVPYFNNIINDNHIDLLNINSIDRINTLPHFNKNTIKEYGWVNFISQPYLDKDFNLIKCNGIRVERTSGTTQEPMDIPWLSKDYYSSMMNHWRLRWERFKISPADNMLTNVRNRNNTNPYFLVRNNKEMKINVYNLSDENMFFSLKHLEKLQPKWLYIQQSVLFLLIKKAKEMKLDFPQSIKYIEYMGEPILPYYRKKIEKILDVESADMYGCVEANGIAYECKYNNLHLLSQNVIVEILQNQKSVGYNKRGNVCITGLHNQLMPFIRYILNDEALMIPGHECSCGNLSPIIKLFITRLPSYLIFDDLDFCNSGVIYYPINEMTCFTVKKNDIIFTLELVDIKKYNITFFIKDKKIDLSNYRNLLVSKFHIIMSKYGVNDIEFDYRFDNYLFYSKNIGILRIE